MEEVLVTGFTYPVGFTYQMPVYVNCKGHGNYGDGGLFTKKMESAGIPAKDDIVIPFVFSPERNNPSDGPAWSVQRRWFLPDGSVTVELEKLYVDPRDPLLMELQERNRNGRFDPVHIWNTDTDPDPVPLMLAQGWVKL